MRRRPLLRQLLTGMSISRYLPPIGNAGTLRVFVGKEETSRDGTVAAFLESERHWVFGRCVTYSATVQGTVVLNF